ncbi:hypothetical protein KIN20_004774 [Parelaphostrongylus tenuis]|uniref:BPI1 domain-containing protein n=1 Tax=Parelaphostrongylus tenuis TaxID=148309 RepID=A0AAD5QI75_PARTN|nr:hypothetical protein KIN20_004774 [Parelaphostrongylus tenuis]
MARNLIDLLLISLLPISETSACGVIPAGQGSTRNINVTGFSLPVSMAFSGEVTVRTQVPMISSSANAAKGFVSRLMMQAVTDVLDQQGRAALLPDAVISMILGQLTIQVTYEPLECKEVFVDKAPGDMRRFRLSSCIWNIRRIEPTGIRNSKNHLDNEK